MDARIIRKIHTILQPVRFIIVWLIGFVPLFQFVACDDEDYLSDTSIAILPDSIFNPGSNYIAVIGDIQEYTLSSSRANYLNYTYRWIKAQQEYFGAFACVLQNGDITEHNTPYQWERADISLSFLGDSILFIPSTGNHDYTWGTPGNPMEITDRNSTMLNELKNLSTLRQQSLLQYEEGKLDNVVVPVKIGRKSLYIIALEFGPRKEAVSWADSIVRSNKDRRYILMTHEWMSSEGERLSERCYATSQFPNQSYSTPQEIWEKMVYPNDNVLCVLCGHNGFCKYLFSPNRSGREVCQILFNLQYQENGGNGLLQLWEFPEDKEELNISVYNTVSHNYHPDPTTRIHISLN